jgi:hypothetical protein
MPRDLKRSEQNRLVIADGISGDKIVLFYRQPTAAEYIRYHSETVERKDGKTTFDEEARIDFAREILTGAADGCLVFDGRPVSTDPANPAYDENWKQLIRETAADWLMLLAGVAFDGQVRVPEVPFETSLKASLFAAPRNAAENALPAPPPS